VRTGGVDRANIRAQQTDNRYDLFENCARNNERETAAVAMEASVSIYVTSIFCAR